MLRTYFNMYVLLYNSISKFQCLKIFARLERNFDLAETNFLTYHKMAKLAIFLNVIMKPKGNFQKILIVINGIKRKYFL